MTETTEPHAETPAAAGHRSPLAGMALLVAVMGLVVAVAVAALPWVPALQRLMPAPPVPETTNYDAAIGLMQHQLAQLNQKVDSVAAVEVPVADLSPLEGRIAQIEQQLAALANTVNEQREKADALQPAGLAFVRVETRLLRGEPFRTELDLLRQLAKTPLTAEQDRDLSAAALGVATTEQLVAKLREHERAARRAERMNAVSGPLDRIWAELQSLVLVRDTAAVPTVDTTDRFDALVAAIRYGDQATTNAAWQGLSDPAKKVLAVVYNDVERRQRAEAALQQLAPAFLTNPAVAVQ